MSTISVIVPVRNDPYRLRKCLASLNASTRPPCEIIVVDDASTDEQTPRVAAELGAKVLRLDCNLGPGGARNRGAQIAQGDILFFIDADCCAHPDTLQIVADTFAGDPGVDATFGSYDLEPEAPAFLAQYKNLFHRYVHQNANQNATTFWAGAGAMKRSVFLAAGGFDHSLYGRPCIEDIELGARLWRDGKRIVINRQLQVCHLKRWTFKSILKSDILDRGIPWTRLILREKNLPNDLNLRFSQRLAAMLACVVVASVVVGAWWHPWLLAAPVAAILCVLVVDLLSDMLRGWRFAVWVGACAMLAMLGAVVWQTRWWSLVGIAPLLGIVMLNHHFYAYWVRHRSLAFAVMVVPMHVLYYLYSGFCLAAGMMLHLMGGRSPAAPARGEQVHVEA